MVIERAIIRNMDNLGSNGGTGFSFNPETSYIREGEADVVVVTTFEALLPLDSSPREILNTVINTVIAGQPDGFNLSPRDIIILSTIERG